MGVVTQFVYDDWKVRYPEFNASVNAAQATDCFNLATTFQRNDGGGNINDATQAKTLLYMLTAHIAQINYGSSVQSLNGIVGRISSAGEGSVNASIENSYPPGTVQWYQQTKYGSMWWAATAGYRTFKFVPGFKRVFSPFGVRIP